MKHSFEVELATKYGIAEALLLGYFQYYIEAAEKNQEKEKFHEGRYWTYASLQTLTNNFKYITKTSLRRVLQHLVDEDLLLKGNFNKLTWDKTVWYALSDKAISEIRRCAKMAQEVCQNGTGVCQNGTTIPIQSTYFNPPIRGNAREQTNKAEVVNENHDPRFPGTKYSQEVYSQAVDAYVKFINLPLNANDVDEICCMVDEWGLEATTHGLRIAAKNKVRKLSYVAACARNYVEDKGKPKSQRKAAKPKNDVEGMFNELMAKYGGEEPDG